MANTVYEIPIENVEGNEVRVVIQSLDPGYLPGDPVTDVTLTGSENAIVLESVESDEDKMKTIKGRRLNIGFLSDDDYDVEDFADDNDSRYKVYLFTGGGPFVGNLVLDDNSEAFQPKPNPVQLRAGEGLGSLKDLELRDGEDLAFGHYSIIEYLVMILTPISQAEGVTQNINVIFNLYETDTDPLTSHAFIDTYINALTFETDVDKREDMFTVLSKIMDALGCFITYDNDGWWIIRWDEYDRIGTSVLTHRRALFSDSGTFGGYDTVDLTKTIAHDQDVLYEGYFMSFDSAQKRYQRRAKSVTHEYRYEQPKEVPCNASFTRGTPDDTVLPLITFDPECWTLRKGVPGSYSATSVEMKIAVHHDANDVEDDRYLYLTPEATHSGSSTSQTYAESEGIEVHEKDKFDVEVKWRLESDADFGNSYNVMKIYLAGDDGSHWLLGNTTIANPATPLKWWNTSGFTVNTGAGGIDIDFTLIEETEWQSQSFEDVPEIPVDGKIYIWLHQINQTVVSEDNQTINYSDLRFTYIPYVGGSYRRINGHTHKVTGDNESRKEITHQMYLGDSPKKLFKGALKKFDGSNYVLCETWSDFGGGLTMADVQLGKHTVFSWWNQYRKTRTVIETDVQGLNSDEEEGTPGLIHRWKIIHGDQEDKFFMLTSFRGMDFYKCGWQGVFVETSDFDGDRDYDDEYEFKYIYG